MPQIINSQQAQRRSDNKILTVVKGLTGRAGDDVERFPPTPPDLEGTLDKLKHKTSLLGAWNKRYFIIDRSTARLLYYNTKQDYALKMSPSGAIELADVRSVRKFNDTTFQIEAPQKTFMLRAESKAEFTCWTTALQEYIAQYQDYERWRTIYDNAKKTLNDEP